MASNTIQSAVAFLRDPSVQDSSLAKKVAFLEAKGLSQQEVDTALRLAATGPSSVPTSSSSYPRYSQYGSAMPPSTRPDYRDWFIMAVVGGGVGTLAYSLARKYILPALKPPSESELVAAQEALTAKYDEAAAILANLQEETHEIKSTLQEQCSKVDDSVEQVNTALEAIKDKEKERDEELQSMREEVESLKALMEKMFDKHKDAQTASLGDIQQEVKSLKSLLSRRADAVSAPASSSAPQSSSPSLPQSQSQPQLYAPRPSSSPSPYASSGRFGMAGSSGRDSPSFASITNRPPGIPAWQMQAQPQAAAAIPASSSSSSSLLPPSIANAPPPAASITESGNTNASEASKALDTKLATNGNGSSGSEGGTDLAESAEMVEASEITA